MQKLRTEGIVEAVLWALNIWRYNSSLSNYLRTENGVELLFSTKSEADVAEAELNNHSIIATSIVEK